MAAIDESGESGESEKGFDERDASECHDEDFERQATQRVRKGRGSVSNTASRYLPTRSVAVDDGWENTWYLGDEPDPVRTRFYPDRTKHLITRNQSPDIPFAHSINAFKGCEHGCIYCFARPTHAFLDLSPGLDFETRLFFKTDVRAHLHKELARKGYRCSTLAMGTNTDPYQPLEKRKRVTREVLETLLPLRHPISIVTKSALILRDLDLLEEFARQQLVSVHVSVTTLDNALKTKLEPRTAAPAARLRTIEALNAAGVPTGAMLAPIIPFINDHELEDMASACADAGARALGYILLRLPLEVSPLFQEWLQAHYPLKAERVMAAVRSTRGGRDYKSGWHKRMVGEGEIADLLRKRFHAAVRRVGLEGADMPELRTDLFVSPQELDKAQMELF